MKQATNQGDTVPLHTTAAIERPQVSHGTARFGSDEIADALRQLEVPYFVCNPGASYRGLHDSLINYLGNERPQMMVCLHEEHAVGIAHGYAKVTGKPLIVGLHANVGLMHATMALFNAWCDRVPMLVIGATGPVDASKRRPWIDWIHTARDQGSMIRSYTKWDDQPASAGAARESIFRAAWLSQTHPCAPTYVNLDAAVQEAVQAEPLAAIDGKRYMPAVARAIPEASLTRLVSMLNGAQRPVVLMGRVSRSQAAWDERLALIERIAARVVTDLKVGAAFPTDHPLHAGPAGIFLAAAAKDVIRDADLILSLDWVDLAGTLQAACGTPAPAAFIVQASLDHALHNGASMDHQALPAVDLFIEADPEALVAALAARLDCHVAASSAPAAAPEPSVLAPGPILVDDLAPALANATAALPVSLLHLPLSWNGAAWPFRAPLDYIGSEAGGGVGGGPSIAVGAALALRDSGRLPVAIVGDGDFLMGATALWTAVHYRIPLLIIIANNQSFYNDEIHQESMARARGRPIENKWIGQRLTDPEIDLCAIASAQGAVAFGPVTDRALLSDVLRQAVDAVRAGAVAVCDVRVQAGYAPAMANALRSH